MPNVIRTATLVAFVLSAVQMPSAVVTAAPAAIRAAAPAAAAATTTTMYLRVESARQWVPSGLNKGAAIPHYHWVINQDDTGDPSHYGTNLAPTDTRNSNFACVPQSRGGDPAYPANCQWPGTHAVKGGTTALGGPAGAQDSEIVAQGNETAFAPDANGNPTIGITTTNWPQNDHNPNRSYMISVMADGFDVPGCVITGTVTCHADGFKIDGQWFSLPLPDNGVNQPNVTVDMQPYPLPLTTVRMAVWNDTQTNGAYDTGEPMLAGFEGHIDDVLGHVITDWYGNPLCSTYKHDVNGLMIFGTDGRPVIDVVGGHCFSKADGVITIPYLGPNRYAATVTAPNGQVWYQTSTLEGWHDWDVWSIEGWNGYDPEFVQGSEPFPFAEFGFVQITHTIGLTNTPVTGHLTDTGSVKGIVVGTNEGWPQVGGLPIGGNGKKLIENINKPLISLIDTNNNDNTVFVGRGNADGTFQISNVPNGDYVLTFWDEDQSYMLTQSNVHIVNGQAVDMGVLDVAPWHSQVYGKVCQDINHNGKCDPGEPGIPNLVLNLLGRDNSVQFYGDNTATTDKDGNYRFRRAYPLTQWVVTQGYWEQYYTVGVTYQTSNQPVETTMMANGGFVDVSTLNIIGNMTRMDWAVHTYETPATANLGPVTGGIVGEMVYDSTRNETDSRFSFNEMYQPGISGIPVHLYAPVTCNPALTPITGTACTPTTTAFGSENYLTINDPTNPQNGAYVKLSDGSGNPIDLFQPYVSETWKRPTDCMARGITGGRVAEQVLPALQGDTLPGNVIDPGGHDCLEAPLMSSQVGNNTLGTFMQVNGNYGFTQIDHDPTTGVTLTTPIQIPPADYIVEPQIPTDPRTGKLVYEVTKEEEVNIMSGDRFVAPGETPVNPPSPNRTPPVAVVPAIPPFPCVGPLHTVHVVTDTAQALFDPLNPALTQGIYNPDFVAGGGSPYEGLQKPLCTARLVTVRNGRSATPNFHWHTQGTQSTIPVPLPGRLFGIIVDDLNLSTNPKELFFGEKYGLPNMPIGIYDFANRLVKTIQSDPNGAYEVMLPSTSSYNCPLPAGPCPGIYRLLANDPGQPGHPNPGFNPGYRSIGGFFEVWPGVSLPSDLAPTPVAFGVFNPGTQQTHPAACLINDPLQTTAPLVPEFYSVSKPYARSTDVDADRTITITGLNFGAVQGTGKLTLDGSAMTVNLWSDRQIVITVPAAFVAGPHQLLITSANGQSVPNGLTFHLLGGTYNPQVYEVGPGKTYDPGDPNPALAVHAIQRAIDAASHSAQALVVVYPGITETYNALGSYYENLIIHSPLKLQGVGPGGVYSDGTHVPGTVIDALGYGTDSAREADWAAELASVGTIVGPNLALVSAANETVPEGEAILFLATSPVSYTTAYQAGVDGTQVQNGDVMDFVPSINTLGTGLDVGGTPNTPTNPNQGGGIVAYASTSYLQITNNIIRSNAGAYAGAIRLGTPLVGDSHLDGTHIAYNRILNNGGTNLAGAIGIFTGNYGYEINNNDICGNFSSEYGGGISHFGLTGPLHADGTRIGATSLITSSIHNNRIYFNGAYDEGAGVMIAGEPPTTPTGLSNGAGPVDIYGNIIEANLAADDGGGLRFLTAGNFPYNVYNNFIVANISAHEGAGVAIDNAPNVRFYNNTVMNNQTTATAATSDGQPAPAGLSTGLNNNYLQATLPAGSPLYSNPLMFNNIFWDNRAGTWDPASGMVRGIGSADSAGITDTSPINYWDMGVPGTAFQLSPTNSVLQSESFNHNDVVSSPTNKVDLDPLVIAQYHASVLAYPWRGNPNFVANTIVAQDVPVSIMGDYHLSTATSPAVDAGAASQVVPSYQQPPGALAAPTVDIDGQGRPQLFGFDIGADEVPGANADLSITKATGSTRVAPGGVLQYTIIVSNNGPSGVALAPVTDIVPAELTGVTWTCVAAVGSSCGAASGSGNINTVVTLPVGGYATFILSGTVLPTATSGAVINTATIQPPFGIADPDLTNNSATVSTPILALADVGITKSDGQTIVSPGQAVTYTIVVTNAGPDTAISVPVTDIIPSTLAKVSWTCAALAGSSCGVASGSGNITATATLPVGGIVTFTLRASISNTLTSGPVVNTASVGLGVAMSDPFPGNNSATDTDTLFVPLSPLALLDNFNRANANNLGVNWSQLVNVIQINTNQAFCNNTGFLNLPCIFGGQAVWNGPGNIFGNLQGAAVTFANATMNGTALILKASGGSAAAPANFIRVRYGTGPNQIVVATTTNSGIAYATQAIFPVTFVNGDTLSAVAYPDGTVFVYKTTGAITTLIGSVVVPITGVGRIGVQLPPGARVDNFSGGTVSYPVLASFLNVLPGTKVYLPFISVQ